MSRKASPTAWAEEAQAVTGAKFTPLKPVRMEMFPAAILLIIMGMKKTETRFAPFSRNFWCSSSRVCIPPMPLPTMTPTR